MEPRKIVMKIYLIIILASIYQFSFARPVKTLTYKEMMQKAELIIICNVESSTIKPDQEISGMKMMQMQTQLSVISVIKGDKKLRKVTIEHQNFVNKKDEHEKIDGPTILKFNPDLKNTYLVFLKKKDGKYEPFINGFDIDQSFKLLKDYHQQHESK